MANLADWTSIFEALGHRGFAVDAERCVAMRNRHMACNRCVDACPSGCLTVENGRIGVETSHCIGCGTCATACPTGALVKTEPTNAEIMAEVRAVVARNAGTAVFACASIIEKAGAALDPDTVVKVACLGRIDEELLVQTKQVGATRIIFVTDACDTCTYGKAEMAIAKVTGGVRSLFAAWDISCPIRVSAKFPKLCAAESGASYDAQRREFLASMRTLAKDGGVAAVNRYLDKSVSEGGAVGTSIQDPFPSLDSDEAPAMPAIGHVGEDGTLAHRPAVRFAALNAAMAAWGDPVPDAEVESRIWARFELDEAACSGCAMCAVFCPTGALVKRKLVDEEASARPMKLYRAPGNPKVGVESKPVTVMKHHPGTSASNSFATGEAVFLLHAPGLCVQCGTCAALCPKHAITLHQGVPAADLRRGYTQAVALKDVFREKGGPDAMRNSMSKLISGVVLWG